MTITNNKDRSEMTPKLLDDSGKQMEWLAVQFLAVKLSLYLTEN